MSKIYTSEQVSRGHVDKICDQIADAIVTDCLTHDQNSRVAVECLIKHNTIIIVGEITNNYEPNYAKLVCQVMNHIGIEKLGYEKLEVKSMISKQSADIALGVDKGGAGDQGIMFGYATNETSEMLPIPFAVATRFIQHLEDLSCEMFKADAQAQVSYDYESGHITTFLYSIQHNENASLENIRTIIEPLMILTAAEYGLNTDFEKLINPTGRFVLGGSKTDCGVTGRKLACDTYSSIGRIGGGALSGKDPSKVDRSGAYIARKIAKDIVRASYADKCEVQIAYAIGKPEPVSIVVNTFGTGRVKKSFFLKYINKRYDLTPTGIIKYLHLLDVDYNEISSGGHFGKEWMPWEMDDNDLTYLYGEE